MGYPIRAGITRFTDACKHCYLLIAHRAICISRVYSVGVLAVPDELLYLGDCNKSEITVLVTPHLTTR